MAGSIEVWEKKLVGKVYVGPDEEAPKGKEVMGQKQDCFFFVFLNFFFSIKRFSQMQI